MFPSTASWTSWFNAWSKSALLFKSSGGESEAVIDVWHAGRSVAGIRARVAEFSDAGWWTDRATPQRGSRRGTPSKGFASRWVYLSPQLVNPLGGSQSKPDRDDGQAALRTVITPVGLVLPSSESTGVFSFCKRIIQDSMSGILRLSDQSTTWWQGSFRCVQFVTPVMYRTEVPPSGASGPALRSKLCASPAISTTTPGLNRIPHRVRPVFNHGAIHE